MYTYIEITNAMCKKGKKKLYLKNLSPIFLGGGGGEGRVISKGEVIGLFNYDEQNGYLKMLIG